MKIQKIAFRLFIKYLLKDNNFDYESFHNGISQRLFLSGNNYFSNLYFFVTDIIALKKEILKSNDNQFKDEKEELIIKKISDFENKFLKTDNKNTKSLLFEKSSISHESKLIKFDYFRFSNNLFSDVKNLLGPKLSLYLNSLYMGIFGANKIDALFKFAIMLNEIELALYICNRFGGNSEWFPLEPLDVSNVYVASIANFLNLNEDNLHLLKGLSQKENGHSIIFSIMAQLLITKKNGTSEIIYDRYLAHVSLEPDQQAGLPWILAEFLYKKGKFSLEGPGGLKLLLRAFESCQFEQFCLNIDPLDYTICFTELLHKLLDIDYFYQYVNKECFDDWECWDKYEFWTNLDPLTGYFSTCIYALLERADLTLKNQKGEDCFKLINILEKNNWRQFSWSESPGEKRMSFSDAAEIRKMFKGFRIYLENLSSEKDGVELECFPKVSLNRH